MKIFFFSLLCATFCVSQTFARLLRNPFIKCPKNHQRAVVASACMHEGDKVLFVHVDGKIRCIKQEL